MNERIRNQGHLHLILHCAAQGKKLNGGIAPLRQTEREKREIRGLNDAQITIESTV
jgi:hypothetical protein